MSDASDFTIEVRDRDFQRVGQIAPEYTDIKFVDVHNGVGAWELKLPNEHPLLPDLTTKGAGIVVTEHWMEGATHRYRVYSGRMRSARLSQDAADPAGTWVVSGVDDNVIGAATRVYPDPASPATAQTAGYWEQAGPGETVMKLAVQLNAGSAALPARRYPWLTIAANQLRGLGVKTSSRFDVLGDLLTSLGTAAGLGWEFRQEGDLVAFDVYEPADKRGEVRLDIRNGGLESNELGFTAPSASEVLVLGQGEGADRTVLQVTSPEAAAEAVEWGLRWEQVKDQRNTDDPDELQQAGDEILAEQGATVNSLKVVPGDVPGMRLGRDWYRGDRVTVVVDGQETSAVVTQVATSISAAGVIRQVTVGDPVGFDFDAKIASKVKDHEARIGKVERLIDQVTVPGSAFMAIGDVKEFLGAAGSLPAGVLPAKGQAVSRATYADLFALIGTRYGAGDGSTTFNLPKLNSFDAENQFSNPRVGNGPLATYNASNVSMGQDQTFPGITDANEGWMHAQDFGIYLSAPTTQDSYVGVDGDGGGMRNGMRAGKTYVCSATGSVRTVISGEIPPENTQNMGSHSRARSIVVHTWQPGGVGYKIWHSPAVPNVLETGGLNPTNEHRVSVEFTVPADAQQVFIRFYLGGTGGAITWTRPTLIRRDSAGQTLEDLTEWFNGYTKPRAHADFRWAGGADSSYPVRIARSKPGTIVGIRAL
ncbi:minor tail protein [Microbacterium phage Quenya]|uniref:minor tail protein n=1 Tax=Microbacterium phage Quenya TaxID=2776868 RepID=UPI0018A43BA5|nr:minor tail protein [Microbacterium phage Quenya]QOP64253.1 minor tail protein [Microbacterium phage Quenya]